MMRLDVVSTITVQAVDRKNLDGIGHDRQKVR